MKINETLKLEIRLAQEGQCLPCSSGRKHACAQHNRGCPAAITCTQQSCRATHVIRQITGLVHTVNLTHAAVCHLPPTTEARRLQQQKVDTEKALLQADMQLLVGAGLLLLMISCPAPKACGTARQAPF
jgi:hypothetical protein